MRHGIRVEMQLAEVFGSDNKYYCSLYHRREVADIETLLIYFIRFGGATDFGRRWEQAMSADNRWYCSEHYRQPIGDERILWHYYMLHREDNRRNDPAPGGMNIAC